MTSSKEIDPPGTDITTYRRIRKAIGVLGIGLPIALFLLSCIPYFKTDIQHSISDFYFTNFRDLFTGIMCATGLFLVRYDGHRNPVFWKNDRLLTNIAGVMAFGVAFLPTNPDDCVVKVQTLIPFCDHLIGWLHNGFAAVFFLALAIISIYVFTIGQKTDPNVPKSLFDENHIYRTCGWVMIISMALILVFKLLKIFPGSILIFETVMLFAFGISWLIKGRILGDKGEVGKKLYREAHKTKAAAS